MDEKLPFSQSQNFRLIVFALIALAVTIGIVILSSLPDAATRKATRHLESARIAFQEGKWQEALDQLDQTTRTKEAADLRDSVQYHIDIDTVSHLMAKLKYMIQEHPDREAIVDILSLIGCSSKFKDIIKYGYSNGFVIADVASRVAEQVAPQIGRLEELKSELVSTESSLSDQKGILADLKKQDIVYRRFTIVGVVTTAHQEENGEKTLESTANLTLLDDNFTTAALIDNEGGRIPNGSAMKTYSFAVKSIGRKYFLRSNGYDWFTVGKGPAYEIVSSEENPFLVNKSINELINKKDKILNSLSEMREKIRTASDIILTNEMDKMKSSF